MGKIRILLLGSLTRRPARDDPGGRTAAAKAADPKQWDDTVDKAVAYLRKTQAEDGSWGRQADAVGVTGIVADRPAQDRQGRGQTIRWSRRR